MLQTLREYALEKLARSGEEDHLRRRHAQCFIDLLHAHRLDECLPDVDPRTSRMLVVEEERENFRAALEYLGRTHALLEEALAIEREHNLTHAHAHTLVHLANTYMAEGRFDRALAVLEEALLATEAGSGARVLVQVNLAYVANVERRHTDAAELAQEVLERAFAIGHSHNAAVAALELAWSLAELHQPERSARILGAALEFYRDAGTFMYSDEAESEQAIRNALGAQLDERTFHALLAEGRSMTVEQAVREECRQTAQRA